MLISEAKTTDAASALVSESHQFVIDEEGLAAQQITSNLPGPTNGTHRAMNTITRVRKGISIAEYLEKKENGTL
jgi:hypothetical protein